MINLSRRHLVFGATSLLAAGALGKTLLVSNAFASAPLVNNLTLPADFLALSMRLTGIDKPDLQLGQRLHDWLKHADPQLAANMASLNGLLDAHQGLAPDAFQAQIAAQPAGVAALYQALLGGWYLGVVGSKMNPVCVGFETIVSYQLLSTSFTPPSYCAGEPNFWIQPPQSESVAHV
ncbi:sugar dehydrogenase complex small subunit [Pseudomonas sp. App30]|uniref:sugar dehydrogenase complex small subunit n=1 Tax=Pseudomonas sp. App30 TaxID=3068990 RepID=UPI003A7F705C